MNLIYGYFYVDMVDKYCINTIDNVLGMTLGNWLLTISVSSLFFLILFFTTLYFYYTVKSDRAINIKFLFSLKCLCILANLFLLVWSILGLYMYQHTFSFHCKSGFMNVYMWIQIVISMLIYGFLNIFMYYL